MTTHKAIRDAAEEGPYYTAMVAKPDLRALIADLDAKTEALRECHSTLTDERLGQWHYMEGSQIYSDFKQAADRASAALKGTP